MDAIETMDSSLMSAMVKSLETGSLTPMIKEELRLKIQTSRLAAGKEELPDVVFKEPEKHAVNILFSQKYAPSTVRTSPTHL